MTNAPQHSPHRPEFLYELQLIQLPRNFYQHLDGRCWCRLANCGSFLHSHFNIRNEAEPASNWIFK